MSNVYYLQYEGRELWAKYSPYKILFRKKMYTIFLRSWYFDGV